MQPIDSYRGRDNVYRRVGFDSKGRRATYHYHRGPTGIWEDLTDGVWKPLGSHVCMMLDQAIRREDGKES
jgi:hypothetical protein